MTTAKPISEKARGAAVDLKVALIVPCYNEAVAIRQTVGDFKDALPDAQIFVYDNNSTGDTIAVARGMCGLILDTVTRGRREMQRLAYISMPTAGEGNPRP